jgi:hypothetical protein
MLSNIPFGPLDLRWQSGGGIGRNMGLLFSLERHGDRRGFYRRIGGTSVWKLGRSFLEGLYLLLPQLESSSKDIDHDDITYRGIR